jgi:methylmalonyl-CoA/ethylmalonyl-CoA epimerase
MQISYVVQDLQAAIEERVERLGVGSWSITDHFRPQNPRYRDQPSNVDVDVAIAMSYSGATNIELIQQLNDPPSVYLDGIKKHGYGFHDWSVGTLTYERDVERYRSRGDVLAFSCAAPKLTYIENQQFSTGVRRVDRSE